MPCVSKRFMTRPSAGRTKTLVSPRDSDGTNIAYWYCLKLNFCHPDKRLHNLLN